MMRKLSDNESVHKPWPSSGPTPSAGQVRRPSTPAVWGHRPAGEVHSSQWIPHDGERHRAGETISFVESAVNQVVSKRMATKQQIRWSPQGAQLFLQIVANMTTNETLQAQRWPYGFR